MPFTLSHAAAALPFQKLKPVWPALVIGTFAPDLQYFIWISDEDRSGHHFPGIVLLAIPLAVLLLWLFEWFVKGPAIELLPDSVQRRLQNKIEPLSFWGWRRLALIVIWIVIGIATHIGWDQFTHQNTWITAHLEFLRNTVPVPFHAPMLMSKILQHSSTVLGFLAVAAWCAAWYRGTTPVPRTSLLQFSAFRKVTIVSTMALIASFAGYPLANFRLEDHPLPINPLVFIVTVFEAVTLVFCVEVLLYGLVRTFTARLRRLPPGQMDQQRS